MSGPNRWLLEKNHGTAVPASDFNPVLGNYIIGLKARYLYADIRHLINVFKGPSYD